MYWAAPPSHHHMDFEFRVAFFIYRNAAQKSAKPVKKKQTEHSSWSAQPKCTHARSGTLLPNVQVSDRPVTRENDARAGARGVLLALLSRGHDHDGARARTDQPVTTHHAALSQILRPATRCPVVVGRAVTWHVSAGVHRHQQANQSGRVSMIDQPSTPVGPVLDLTKRNVPSVLITCVRSSPRLASCLATGPACCPIQSTCS